MRLTPQFPPLLTGIAAGPADPLEMACDHARGGVDAGLLVWSADAETLRAALVLAPDTPLRTAMAGCIAAAVGLQNALGVLAPAETAVQFTWPDEVRLNGGRVGHLRAAASDPDPDAQPDWLVVGLDLTLDLPADIEPGQTPDRTALALEDCRDVDSIELLEAWARHTLVWITELESPEGRAKLHAEWSGLIFDKDKPQPVPFDPGQTGTILGFDEDFGLLIKLADDARLIPLTRMLEPV